MTSSERLSWDRSAPLAVSLVCGGVLAMVGRAMSVQRAWELANPGGMGTMETWTRLVIENALVTVVLFLAACVVLVVPGPAGTRLRRLAWAAAPLSLFLALVPPREAAFFASGGVSDLFIGPAAVVCCVVTSAACFFLRSSLLGLVSAGLSLQFAALVARFLLSAEGGYGLQEAVEACSIASWSAAALLAIGVAARFVAMPRTA